MAAILNLHGHSIISNHPSRTTRDDATTTSMESAGGSSSGDADDAEASARLLEAMAHALERLVARNDQIALQGAVAEEKEEEEEEEMVLGVVVDRGRRRRGLVAFRGPRMPSISVGKYLERIQRYTGCSSSCFVVGFVYIDRMAHRHPASPVVSLNVHRLILTSVLIASKVLDDTHHNNAFFAKVGGVSNAELNRMELELLFLLDFGVTVSLSVFESYCCHLEKEMAYKRADDYKNIATVSFYSTPENGNVQSLDGGDDDDDDDEGVGGGEPSRPRTVSAATPSYRLVT